MKEREMKMEDIGNVCIDIDDLDHAIFHKEEAPDGKEIEEAFNKGGNELSKTFYTSYDEE